MFNPQTPQKYKPEAQPLAALPPGGLQPQTQPPDFVFPEGPGMRPPEAQPQTQNPGHVFGEGPEMRPPGGVQPQTENPGHVFQEGPGMRPPQTGGGEPPMAAQQALAPAGAPAAKPTIAGTFQNKLLELMDPKAPSLQDPALAAQVQANSVAGQRGYDRRRAMAAERAAASGTLHSGGYDAGLDTLAAARSDDEGRFNAGLLGREIDGQRTRQLAGLELGLRNNLGQGQLGLGLLGQMQQNDQFGRSLNQNNQQFGQNLGFQSGLASANLNQQALMNLLNGL